MNIGLQKVKNLKEENNLLFKKIELTYLLIKKIDG
jgi:hypothetical protein